eukprot:CAMPEP_0181198016 /NCGR_PEP_ID=MMETSP1096-20121128/16370_1 /TAXON_ID=156174 ORGANISM="Chrysochromulina ericina, Strain CCMP281" /NCGR_SAMPLE_ID=MMETSP1096 /ASSEMBLY_ACC=CAM_ASM_000453 /LENGTH=50 /DNA_ID=CAMNT_0023288007 /DNA_START=321 /DNA_END=473 /DNA_ORIENTATION=-
MISQPIQCKLEQIPDLSVAEYGRGDLTRRRVIVDQGAAHSPRVGAQLHVE